MQPLKQHAELGVFHCCLFSPMLLSATQLKTSFMSALRMEELYLYLPCQILLVTCIKSYILEHLYGGQFFLVSLSPEEKHFFFFLTDWRGWEMIITFPCCSEAVRVTQM